MRLHRVLVPMLGLAGIALAGGFVWAAVLPTGYCGRYRPPSGWIDGALIVFALGAAFLLAPLTLSARPLTRAYWLIAAVTVAEAAAAIALVVYLASRFLHAYDCG